MTVDGNVRLPFMGSGEDVSADVTWSAVTTCRPPYAASPPTASRNLCVRRAAKIRSASGSLARKETEARI
jgi:hypothetical protein